MSAIDKAFVQFRGMAKTSWNNQDLVKEMFAKGWVIHEKDSAWAIDVKATTTNTIDLLLSHLDLFNRAKFVPYLERVFQKLDEHNENKAVFKAAKKSACAVLLRRDITTLTSETQLFLLKEAIVQKDARVVIQLLGLLPHTDTLDQLLNSKQHKLKSLMSRLIEQDQVEGYETLFQTLGLHNVEMLYRFDSLILCENPYLNTQNRLATECQFQRKENGDWTEVTLVIPHNNQHYKVKINIETKKQFQGWQDDIVRAAKVWIDRGFPYEPTSFDSYFSWRPTIEQFGRLLKENVKEFNNRMVWYLQKSAYLALVVNRTGITNEQLKRYFLESPHDHFENHEIRFIFERIGMMDLETAIHFFKLIVSKGFSPKRDVE